MDGASRQPVPEGPGRPQGTDDSSHARPGRPTGLWLRVLLFAAGVAVGVLVVGLLDLTTPDFTAGGSPGAAASNGPQPRVDRSVAPGAEVQVNAACLGVLNEAQDVYAVLGDLGRAVDDVDLTALDEIVRRLQPVEPQLGRDLASCRVGVGVSSGEPSAAPTAPLTTPPPVEPSSPGPTR